MAEVMLRVTLDDNDPFMRHYGVNDWLHGLEAAICAEDIGNSVEVLHVEGPAGHACGVCGGATPHEGCSPGRPPNGVPYLECCTQGRRQ